MTSAEAATENGRPFMSCSVTVPVTSPAPVRTACGVHGPAWSRWFSSHDGAFWTAADYEVGVNSASAISALLASLSQQRGAS
jgi:hypothetical protein